MEMATANARASEIHTTIQHAASLNETACAVRWNTPRSSRKHRQHEHAKANPEPGSSCKHDLLSLYRAWLPLFRDVWLTELHRLAALAAPAQIQQFNKDGKAHREVDIAFRNVLIEA